MKYGSLPAISKISPKGSEWKLIYKHQHIKKDSIKNKWTIYTIFVFNYEKGLTAFEAWQIAKIRYNPPFHLIECIQLKPF